MKSANNQNKINIYINNIIESRCTGGIDNYHKELIEHITEKYNIDNPLIYRVIHYIELEDTRVKQDLNPSLKNEDRVYIINYLNDIYKDIKHPLHKYVKKAIEDNIVNFAFVDNITPYNCLKFIIEKIIKNFHILNLYKEDCKNLIKEKRDKKKIINAIDTIQSYTTNQHLLYELEEERQNITHINKTLLLSSFFCEFTYALKNLFKKDNLEMSTSKIQELANDIMNKVFGITKDYRITKHTTSITYKNYVLYRYYYNQEMDKRITFYKKHPIK